MTNFGIRVLLLAAVLAAIAVWDYRRTGELYRVRGYVFIFSVALVGGMFGLVNDLVTSSISADYFAFGKDLGPQEGLRARAVALGFQAGFGAAAFVAVLLLLANSHRKHPETVLSYPRLSLHALKPLGGALACGPLFAVVFHYLDPMRTRADLMEFLTPDRAERFLLVWGVHWGLYIGALAGLVQAFVDIRKTRKKRLASIANVNVGSDSRLDDSEPQQDTEEKPS
jgi:hypothetical protein